MNNILFLIKANILNSWGINKILKSRSKGEKLKALLLGIVIIYAFCNVMLAMFIMSFPLSQVLEKLNALDILISSSILQTTLFALIMSVYKIPGYLYAFKDYDMLMALPLKPSHVIASKMIFVYLSNLMVAVVAGVPPLVVYGIKTSGGPLYYLFVAITTFFIPLIPIAIGAFFAYILGRISSKFRSTNILLLIGSFALFIGIMIGSTMLGRINAEQVQSSIPTITALNDVLFWTKFYIAALRDNSIFYLAVFLLVSVAIFSTFIALFSRGFKSINSKMTEKFRASNYKMTKLKVSAPIKALYLKELKFYFSSYIYVVNTAFGIVMMTIFSLGVAIFGKETVAKVMEIPMADAYLPAVVALVFAFCISFTFTTAASVSLEGKSLWIIKSLPVRTESILWSKILVNLTLTVPALLINMVIIQIAFRMDMATALSLLCVSLLYCLVEPLLGIMINLYFPKLEWTTQVAVVKQSASVLLVTLVSFISILVPIAFFVLLKPKSMSLYLIGVSVVLLVLGIVLIRVVNTLGVKKFQEL